MHKAKKLIALSMAMLFSVQTISALSININHREIPREFSDIDYDSPYLESTTYLKNIGLIEGYSDGTFKPNQVVNRAEAVKMILGIKGLNVWDKAEGPIFAGAHPDNLPFSDVDKNAWYYPYLKDAYANELVQGYSDGTFKPAQQVNLAENLKVALEHTFFRVPVAGKLVGMNLKNPDTLYNDTFSDQWYAEYFGHAKAYGLLDADSKGNVFPAQGMTRGKLADLVYRIIIKDKTELKSFYKVSVDSNEDQGKILLSGKVIKTIDFKDSEEKYLTLLKHISSPDGELVIQECAGGFGGYILFSFCYGTTYIYDVMNSTFTDLGLAHVTDISDDGSKAIYFDREKNVLKVKDLNQNKDIFTYNIPAEYTQYGNGVFSASGEKFAFAVAKGQPNSEAGKVFMIDLANSGKQTEIKSINGGYCNVHAPLAADGEKFTYSCNLVN